MARRDVFTALRLPPALAARLRPLRRRGRGVAAIEFGLILPLMFSMVAGVYDLSQAYVAWERVTTCAQAIDQIATALAANSATVNSLTMAQATTAASAIYAYLPDTQSASTSTFGVTISSVVMSSSPPGCTSGCLYDAHVAWSGVFAGSATSQRPCDLVPGLSGLIPAADNATPTPNTLPTDAYSAASLMVVDVVYTFTPAFFKYITKSFKMAQSAYYPPRAGLTNNWISYKQSSGNSTTLCAGYPSA